jgi:Adenylosuccinate synthase
MYDKADVLDTFENISICIAYDDNNLPIYKIFEGWQEDTSQCSSYDELPNKLKVYIKFIEETVNCKVSIISVGPSREQSIHL